MSRDFELDWAGINYAVLSAYSQDAEEKEEIEEGKILQ